MIIRSDESIDSNDASRNSDHQPRDGSVVYESSSSEIVGHAVVCSDSYDSKGLIKPRQRHEIENDQNEWGQRYEVAAEDTLHEINEI